MAKLKRKDSIRIDSTSDAILLNRWIALVVETKYRTGAGITRELNVPIKTNKRYEVQWQNIKTDFRSLGRDLKNFITGKRERQSFLFRPVFYSFLAFFYIALHKHLEAHLTSFVIGAVSYDSAGETSHSGEPGTINWNITIGSNDDRCVIVSVSGLSGLNDPTFDGNATTDIIEVGALKSNYYLNPGTGSKTCSATGGNIKVGGAISLYGVDQQVPIGSFITENGSSSPNDMSLTTQEDNSMRIDVLGSNRDNSTSVTASLDSGDLRHDAVTPQNQFRIGLFGYTNFQATAGADTHQWTTNGFSRWYGAFEVKAVLDTPSVIGTPSGGFTTSQSHEVVSGTDVLVIAVANRQGTISNVQWNGASATKKVGAATAFNESVELWYINNPTPGTGNITASFSSGDGRVLYGINVQDADTSGTYDSNSATGTSSNPNVTITTTEENVIIIDAGISEGDYSFTGPEQRTIANIQSASYQNFALSRGEKGNTGTRRVDWYMTSSQRWAHVIMSIPASPGSVTTTQTLIAKGNIQQSTAQTCFARGCIQKQSQQSVSAKANIEEYHVTYSKTINAKGYLGPGRIFEDGFETGDTSEWSNTQGTILVEDNLIIAGAYTLEIDSTDIDSSVRYTLSPSLRRIRARMYFDTSELSFSDDAGTRIMLIRASNFDYVANVELDPFGDGRWKVRLQVITDTGTVETQYYTISSGLNFVEVDVLLSGASGADNGFGKLWLNGDLKETLSNIDNDTLTNIGHLDFGIRDDWGTTKSGSIYIDEIAIDGSNYIGPSRILPQVRSRGRIHRILKTSMGMNVIGLEFGSDELPGTEGEDYTENTENEFIYVASKGFNLVVIPFLWERIQPTINGSLDSTYKSYIDQNIAWARAHDLKVRLKVQNFGRRDVSGTERIIGSAELPISAFVDLWDRLSEAYKDDQTVVQYDLMNEPHDMPVPTSPTNYIQSVATANEEDLATNTDMQQQAVDAIRANNDTTWIVFELDNWAGAQTFVSSYGSDPDPIIDDPENKIIYSAHYYMDDDHSGSYVGGYDSDDRLFNIGGDVTPFFSWIESNGLKGDIGEYGVPYDDDRWLACLNSLLNLCADYNISPNYWAMGQWYMANINFQPTDNYTVDRNQWNALQNFHGVGALGSYAKTISARGNIVEGAETVTQTIHAIGNIRQTQSVSIYARGRIQAQQSQEITTRGSIRNNISQSVSARARIIRSITLQRIDGSKIGMNYYHESMGYITRNNAQIKSDLDKISPLTKKIKVYRNPYTNAGGVSAANSLIIVKNIVTIAKSMGFYVVWVENNDSTTLTDANWSDYESRVIADAAEAQSVGADEFLVGNEISIHNNGDDGFSDTNLPANIKQLVTDCETNFPGIKGFQEGWWKHWSWNSAGLGSLDKIYFTLYEQWHNYKEQFDSIQAEFSTDAEIGELSTSSTENGLDLNDEDWAIQLMRRYDYARQKGLTVWPFTFKEPSDDSFGYFNASGTVHEPYIYLKGLRTHRYNELFLESFASGIGKFTTTGGATNESGRLRVDSFGNAVAGWFTDQDYVFRGKINLVSEFSGDSWVAARPIVRYTDNDNYYFVNIAPNGGSAGIVQLYRRSAGGETWLGEVEIELTLGQDWSFEIRISGQNAATHIQVFLKDQKLFDLTDTGNSTINAGKFGFRNNGVVSDADDIVVTSLEEVINLGAHIDARGSIKKQQSQSISCVGRIEQTESVSIESAARIEKQFSQTISVRGRIETTESKTIIARGRIENTYDQEITAQGSIKVNQQQTVFCRGRIQRTESSTISARGRIEVLTTQTITAVGRIETTEQQSIYALGRIEKQSSQSITARGDIKKNLSQTVEAGGSIQRNTSQSADSLGRIKKTISQTIFCRGNIQAPQVQTISAKGAITTGLERTITARGNIFATSNQSVVSVGRVKKQFEQQISSRGRVQIVYSVTISGVRGRILKEESQTIISRGRIKTSEQQIVSAKGCIQTTTKQTVFALARINTSGGKTVYARARIIKQQIKNISSVGNIERTESSSIVATGRIKIQEEQQIISVARILVSESETVISIGRIKTQEIETIVSVGRIRTSENQSLDSKGRIKRTEETSINASAYILRRSTRVISAKAAIASLITQEIQAKARLVLPSYDVDIVEIVTGVRAQEIVKEVTYTKTMVKEVSYTRVMVRAVTPQKQVKLKWMVVKARIIN